MTRRWPALLGPAALGPVSLGRWPTGLTHRTPGFWAWFGLLAASLLVSAVCALHLFSHRQERAAVALLDGHRVVLRLADGHIIGKLAPSTEPAKPAAVPTPPPAPAKPTPSAQHTEEPPAKPDTRSPAARIPPRDHPEVQEQPLPPLTNASAAEATPPAAAQPAAQPLKASTAKLPMQMYARPSAVPVEKPRMALVVTQLGMNETTSNEALSLPADVSLSLSPYVEQAPHWVSLIRHHGHEALLDLPAEPRDYPLSDAGPYALSPRAKAEENLRRLAWVLGRAQEIVGLYAPAGERFLPEPAAAYPILAELTKRGYLLLTANPRAQLSLVQLRTRAPVSAVSAPIVLDATLSEEGIDQQFAALKSIIVKQGQGVAVLRPYPLSIRKAKAWIATLGKEGITLVPVSALAPAPMPLPTPILEPAKTDKESPAKPHDAHHE